MGAAAACKWSAWPFLSLLLGLSLAWETHRRRSLPAGQARRALQDEWSSLLLAIVVLPVLVYTASFAGTLDGSLVAWPWQEGSWVRVHHTSNRDIGVSSPSHGATPVCVPSLVVASPETAVLFLFRDVEGGGFQVTQAIGNPLVWWPSLAAIGYLAVQ